MKIFFDLFPLLLFFAALKLGDIWIATGVAIVATLAQVGWLLARKKQVSNILWVNLVIIVVFGGATLVLHDDTFIKWKPTVLYWLYALALLIAEFVFRKNLIRSVLSEVMVTAFHEELQIPAAVWRKAVLFWIGFFTLMGAANLYVAFNFSLDTWATFKVFGLSGMMFVFTFVQVMMLAKYMEQKHPE